MTISLFDAMQNGTRTANGAVAFKSTGDVLVDFFSKVGDARGVDISAQFGKAYKTNPEIALRTLLWARDVRGGAGERKTFRDLVGKVLRDKPEAFDGFIRVIPEVGRWDDLFIFFGTDYEKEALFVIEAGLAAQDGLCAKWMPRQGPLAAKIRAHLDLTPKQYRKMLVGMTNVVEQKMCANDWDIKYEHVPSKAIGMYSRAFGRHDPVGFTAFKQRANAGEVKVNAGAVFPCDVVNLLNRDSALAEAQWKNLPNYLEGVDERLLCVVDVSGSMTSPAGGGSMYAKSGQVTCMDVAISLGIYTSQRLEGIFKDSFITFTDKPTVVKTTGSLNARVAAAKRHVGYSTNLMGVFDAVLDAAKQHSLPESQMPTKIVIISDMQFNAQIRDFNTSTMTTIKRKFAQAGYAVPALVYWNVGAAKYGNSPFTVNETGACIVSGFSPSILTAVLGGETDSVSVMLRAVGKDRYNYFKA
jgi:hypothetical protein